MLGDADAPDGNLPWLEAAEQAWHLGQGRLSYRVDADTVLICTHCARDHDVSVCRVCAIDCMFDSFRVSARLCGRGLCVYVCPCV